LSYMLKGFFNLTEWHYCRLNMHLQMDTDILQLMDAHFDLRAQ